MKDGSNQIKLGIIRINTTGLVSAKDFSEMTLIYSAKITIQK